MTQDEIKAVADKLGIRDFTDPVARQRAITERDLSVPFTIGEGIVINAFVQLAIGILSCKNEERASFLETIDKITEMFNGYELQLQYMEVFQKKLMTEIYRKQKEIYSEIDN